VKVIENSVIGGSGSISYWRQSQWLANIGNENGENGVIS